MLLEGTGVRRLTDCLKKIMPYLRWDEQVIFKRLHTYIYVYNIY